MSIIKLLRYNSTILGCRGEIEECTHDVVNTNFQHNDMRDTGSREAKDSIEAMLDKFLTDTDNGAVTPVCQHPRPGVDLCTRPQMTPAL
jgi:hypothetical protein